MIDIILDKWSFNLSMDRSKAKWSSNSPTDRKMAKLSSNVQVMDISLANGLSVLSKSCMSQEKTLLTHKNTNKDAMTMAAVDALTTTFRHLSGHKILHTHNQ